MSENENVVRAMLNLANRHDGAAIHAYLADAMHASNPSTGVSAASRMHAVQSALLAGFPDLQYRIDRMLPVGDTVVVECTVSGTHKGAFAGVAPTNKSIELPAAFALQIVDGKLVDCRSYFDTLTLMEQLGAIPTPTAGAVSAVA
jgi:steroid delta-isomerase-like uncharacterized protein